ncbi:hypothetical protein [Pseudotenacibaculum haliotis]|uniref:Uncharacterized protein n=1 Tax=Pseudotenacibaculum haliotis TaxID=1862138 RepID=A0ABW5LSG3_9FLAO
MKLQDLLTVELNSKLFQPMTFEDKYGTSFVISGKLSTRKKGSKTFLDYIELKYIRQFGLINYSLNDITNIERGDDPEFPIEVILIDLELRSFTDKSTVIKRKVKKDIPVKKGDIIHLRINRDILDLDLEDDINPIGYNADLTVICRSKIGG